MRLTTLILAVFMATSAATGETESKEHGDGLIVQALLVRGAEEAPSPDLAAPEWVAKAVKPLANARVGETPPAHLIVQTGWKDLDEKEAIPLYREQGLSYVVQVRRNGEECVVSCIVEAGNARGEFRESLPAAVGKKRASKVNWNSCDYLVFRVVKTSP